MPGNPLRGETELKVGEKTFKLCLDVNAFCLVQAALSGMKTAEIVSTFTTQPDDVVVVRALMYGALAKHHEMHLIEAGEVVSEAGYSEARAAIMAVLTLCFGADDDMEDKKPRPPARNPKIRGTG